MRRRHFLKSVALSAAAAPWAMANNSAVQLPDYRGPNVIIVRFGGGVRRRETIEPQHSYCRFFLNELVPRGTFYPQMTIDQFQDINTSHGEGTLYIATGKYEKFKGVGAKIGDKKFLDARFEASVPTMFVFNRFGKTARVFYGAPPTLHSDASRSAGMRSRTGTSARFSAAHKLIKSLQRISS